MPAPRRIHRNEYEGTVQVIVLLEASTYIQVQNIGASMFGILGQKKTSDTHGSLAISTVSVTAGNDRAFRYFLFATVAIAIVAATIENGLHSIMLLVLPIAYLALCREEYGAPFLWSETMGTVLFFVYVPTFCLVMLLVQASVSLPFFIVYFTFGILMVRVLSPLTDRNIWQVIFLSLGLVLVNCILTNHMIFGLLLPFYLFSLMATLLFFHLARYRAFSGRVTEPGKRDLSARSWSGSLARYALVVTCFTAGAFVFFPRPFLALPGLSAAMAGGAAAADLAQQIRYRDMAGMAGNQRIAFMVAVDRGRLPEFPYWRGRVLDRTDGQTWSARSQLRGRTTLVKTGNAQTVSYRIIPYKLQSKIVYSYGLPIWAVGRARQALYITSDAEVVIDSPFLVADSYELTSVEVPLPAPVKANDINVSQDGVTPRIADLARRWTEKASTPRERAATLESRLRSRYRYVLQNPAPPETGNPVEYFLFESRAGNCEYFAGALCLMLRSLQIPARVVEGFGGMETTDNPDEFLVRFSRAHAWVEAVLDGSTWTTLDATPAQRDFPGNALWRLLTDAYDQLDYNWTKYIVYFDRTDQAELLRSVNQLFKGELPMQISLRSKIGSYAVVGIIAVVLILSVSFAVYKFSKRPRDLSAIYTSTMNKLVEKGLLTRVHPWHEENSTEIATQAPMSGQSLAKFMNLYLRGRFGSDPTATRGALEAAARELLENARPRHTAN
jgi:protein-glutamine gamma-glutamyltransferase